MCDFLILVLEFYSRVGKPHAISVTGKPHAISVDRAVHHDLAEQPHVNSDVCQPSESPVHHPRTRNVRGTCAAAHRSAGGSEIVDKDTAHIPLLATAAPGATSDAVARRSCACQQGWGQLIPAHPWMVGFYWVWTLGI